MVQDCLRSPPNVGLEKLVEKIHFFRNFETSETKGEGESNCSTMKIWKDDG